MRRHQSPNLKSWLFYQGFSCLYWLINLPGCLRSCFYIGPAIRIALFWLSFTARGKPPPWHIDMALCAAAALPISCLAGLLYYTDNKQKKAFFAWRSCIFSFSLGFYWLAVAPHPDTPHTSARFAALLLGGYLAMWLCMCSYERSINFAFYICLCSGCGCDAFSLLCILLLRWEESEGLHIYSALATWLCCCLLAICIGHVCVRACTEEGAGGVSVVVHYRRTCMHFSPLSWGCVSSRY